MKTINMNFKFFIMKANFISTVAIATILPVLSSCSAEVFMSNAPTEDSVCHINVTHDMDFAFCEGDALSIFHITSEYDDEMLVGELVYDKETNTFKGEPTVNEGDSVRLIFNNTSRGENKLVYIPSSQGCNQSIPLEVSCRWADGATYKLAPLSCMSQVRISIKNNSTAGYVGYVSLTSYDIEDELVGLFIYSDNSIIPISYNSNEVVYKISPQDEARGYIDMFCKSGRFAGKILFYDARGGFSHGRIYEDEHELNLKPGLTQVYVF